MLTIGQLCASCMFYCHEVPKGSLTDMPQFKPQEIPPILDGLVYRVKLSALY